MTTMEQPASMEVDLTDVEDHDHDYTLKRPFEQVQVTQEVPHPEEREEEERQQHSSPKRAKTNNHMNEEKDNDMNEVEDDDDGDDYEQWRSQQARDPSSSPRGRKFRTLAEINEKDWQAIFTRLLQYKEIHGDCLVPEGYGNDRKCCKLGTWVAEQVSPIKHPPPMQCNAMQYNAMQDDESVERLVQVYHVLSIISNPIFYCIIPETWI